MLRLTIRRLKRNFQLSVITLMGLFGVISITPYAIFRIFTADYIVAITDTFAVISIIIAVVYAWRTNNTVKPGLYLSIIFSGAATIAIINLGINGSFWIYPLILFNFFMVSPARALTVVLSVLLCIVTYHFLYPSAVFHSHYQMLSFLVTSLLSSSLTFIFAFRSQYQRQRLQKLAAHDPLTGAYNRRVMTEQLRKAHRDYNRSGRPYGLLILDLDHFKKINDSFGHLAGDQILIDFVRIIKAAVRKDDQLFRYGGEEFALLLPNTAHDGLTTVANTLQKQILSKLHSPVSAVTASIGGAVLAPDEGWQDWLNRADKQLYMAKNSGRNRYSLAEHSNTQDTQVPTTANLG